ncbi:isopentenyl-diphosphate Delta-isomerase [Rhodoligotrophos defluvii]|uniref:isopentenyl-diphosphate Delta-isomerase n=1 Tax=Rhodoligotrophos defluvii TaxID=2561934 RepID=UPI00148599DA|nr:isopentenyl-diphosphate Delta-isomerase [Rhodoligotrophos defluvii]
MLMPADAREALILIDERNRRVGTAEKYPVHRQGLLHRAFSIFLFDGEGRMLLQRRAAGKYHSAGLWANTCCGHPRPGETTHRAAARRLVEELNIAADLSFAFHARYQAKLDRGMIENEFVYIFGGRAPNGKITPDPAEADRVALRPLDELAREIAAAPRAYAYWLRHYMAHHRPALDRLARQVASGGAFARVTL